MAGTLFTFVQMEFPWALGPSDGRYLLRMNEGPQTGQPERVVVISTVGAPRRGGLLSRRARRRARTRPAQAGPAAVTVARVTVVDPLGLSSEQQASRWLSELQAENEAHAAAQAANRVLAAHRISAADPHTHPVAAEQALAIRAGFGEGEQVADGVWLQARELLLPQRPQRRRAAVLDPQERLAALVGARERPLLCEELVLRARADLDDGRPELAAIELERAYTAALGELARERRSDLEDRLEELVRLQPAVELAAQGALENAFGGAARHLPPPSAPHPSAEGAPSVAERPHSAGQELQHALERLEAALLARRLGR